MLNTSPPSRVRGMGWLDPVLSRVRSISLPMLRISLGAVFVWFDALKIVAKTPVNDLIAGTAPWLNPDWFVPFLG